MEIPKNAQKHQIFLANLMIPPKRPVDFKIPDSFDFQNL